ncbi:MAG: YceI family protein [Bacteroidia bacterium]|nr:YceI family protein [Bacteroidia bacterium]
MLSLAFLITLTVTIAAQNFNTSTGKVGFYSKTPIEDIAAMNTKVLAVLTAKRDLAISILNTNFEFHNKLMQEHFNEKYMESEKYPNSTFKGKINEDIDLTKDGEYKVTAAGKLNIHGVEQERTIAGTLIIKGGTIQLLSNFKVKNIDHKIKIPTVVMTKIQDEIEVKVDLVMMVKK